MTTNQGLDRHASWQANGEFGAIQPLAPVDAPAGLLLSVAAGWNQTLDDWHWHLSAGQGFGIRTTAGQLVATAVALPYPPDFGWVSMVLVDQHHRRRGLAKALLTIAVDHLTAAKLTPMLDATPAGKLVYAGQGFHGIETITRWSGIGAPRHVDTPLAVDPSPIFPLDRRAFGADRSRLLVALARRTGASVIIEDGSFAIIRPGRVASHIGPVVSTNPELAVRLVGTAIERTTGPVIIDVRNACRPVVDMLPGHGFEASRTLTRMAYCRIAGYGGATLVSAIAGPDLG